MLVDVGTTLLILLAVLWAFVLAALDLLAAFLIARRTGLRPETVLLVFGVAGFACILAGQLLGVPWLGFVGALLVGWIAAIPPALLGILLWRLGAWLWTRLAGPRA